MRPEPRRAATVVVVRDGAAGGVEVLLLERAQSRDHNSGAWVFPGGVLERADDEAQAFCDTTEADGLDFRVAAIRECLEECGLFFGTPADPALIPRLREKLRNATSTLPALCSRFGLRLETKRLHSLSHWLTPPGRTKRFDTRFFVAAAPAGQAPLHDGCETLQHLWVSPREALASLSGHLMTPTRATLESLMPFESTQALLAWAAAPRRIERIQPRLALGSRGLVSITPQHPAYDEVGKLDPDGRCHAWCETRPGVPVAIGERVVRLAGQDGRNVYRVGSERDGWEEIVPGSPLFVAQDRMVIARNRSLVPAELLARAEWLALEEGFLVRPL